MSKYTTEVRYICESYAGLTESVGFDNINSVINTAAPLVFNFTFPIFDEAYRLPLETKILRHFYTREICEETVGLWKLRLQDTLNMIMPYYNELYKSALLKFNPLEDVNLTKEITDTRTKDIGETENSSSDTNMQIDTDAEYSDTASNQNKNVSNGISNKRDRYSDTPQGTVNDVNVQNNAYLTNVRFNDDNSTDTTEGNSQTDSSGSSSNSTTNNAKTIDNTNRNTNILDINNYVEHIAGKKGENSYSKLLLEFRKTLINIDEMVINDLNDCFFKLW